MFEAKRHIHIGAEEWVEDTDNNHVDVVVTFPDGTRWISNFYTITCIESIRQDYSQQGHCLNGAYWCGSSPVIIVDKVSRERVEGVVDELIAGGGFRWVFEYFGNVQEEELLRRGYPEGFFEADAYIDSSLVTYHTSLLLQMLERSGEEVRESVKRQLAGYLEGKN